MSDFHYKEAGLQGIFEIAYSTVMQIQKSARLGSGNCISNLILYHAYRDGYLIPHKKVSVESFKSTWKLFEADKGGLVYEPLSGIHENVLEIDFSSLYPSIMVHHNISHETMNCKCCRNNEVPQLGYAVCKKRNGIMKEVLKPVIDRRLYFKRMKKITEGEKKEVYTQKCNALKWLLVTCFGYMGYKNHRFGRIEAHQAICAYGREKLLEAAHICEERGFEIVHGYVDALYIKKKSINQQEIEGIVSAITEKTGIEIVVEGLFKWFCILPRTTDSNVNTPTRFFGLYQNDEFKVRGIQLRRRDTPKAILKMQTEQLEILQNASNAKEFREHIPLVIAKMKEWIGKLNNNLIPLEDLAFKRTVSKKMEQYKANIAQKAVLWQLKKKGVEVSEGESILYLYRDFKSPHYLSRVIPYDGQHILIDYEKYEEAFVKATLELFNFLDYDTHKLTLAAQGYEQKKLEEFTKEKEITAFENH